MNLSMLRVWLVRWFVDAVHTFCTQPNHSGHAQKRKHGALRLLYGSYGRLGGV